MKRLFLSLTVLLCSFAQADEPVSERLAIYEYALYALPDSDGDPKATLEALVKDEFSSFTIVDEVEGPPTEPLLLVTMLNDAQTSYAPPDMDYIAYAGRGLTRQQALAVQDCEDVLIVNIGYPASMTDTMFPKALELMAAVAAEHDSLLWDEATREIFSPAAWREQRIETWNDGVPNAQDHTTIHAYKNGDYVRAITLGMEKFGLPDIAVNDFAWSNGQSVGSLINLVTQTLVEGGDFNDDFSLDVDIEAVRNDQVKTSLLDAVLDNAQLSLNVQFKPEEPEQGDPDNFILEIRFDTDPSLSVQEQQDVLISELFGARDSIVMVDHNAKILAASEAARKKLPGLRDDFVAGLEPGEFIHVKAPFETPEGGNEWMWVEVVSWEGTSIRGLLQNDPYYIPDLRAGAEVEVSMDDVFDYIRRLADGTSEGNETGALIMEAQGQ
ncbi:MAG: DUF2314 domain-containing protein [Pseudomonadota bacterium]